MGWGGVRVDVCCGKGGPAAGRGQRAFCAVRISLAMSSSLRPLASLTDGIAIWGTVRATSVRIITADWPTMVVGALNEAAAAKRESISCESRWHRPRGGEVTHRTFGLKRFMTQTDITVCFILNTVTRHHLGTPPQNAAECRAARVGAGG